MKIFLKISKKYLFLYFKNIFIMMLLITPFINCDINESKYTSPSNETSIIWSKLIYGIDDRKEYYDASMV